MNEKSRNVKKRNWVFVIYPESAPENWRDILQQAGLQAAVSPLHDRDLNADGTPKKPHWHVIVCYAGPTSYNVVCRLSQEVLCGTIPQALEQVRGYYRYLTHKDNPEKEQYNEFDITHINGFDILDYTELTKSEVNKVMRRLQQLVREAHITEYADLMDLLLDSEDYEGHNIANSHTMFFTAYIKSRKYKRHEQQNNEKKEPIFFDGNSKEM